MRRQASAIFVALVFALFVGLLPASATTADNESFAAQVDAIDRSFEPHQSSVGAITRVLDHEPGFQKLASSGGDLVDESLSYLSEPGRTPLQRRIAVLATCRVSVSEWVRFSNKILDLYANHQVDIWEVEDTIFPRRMYSNYAEAYFYRPSVIMLLIRLYRLDGLDDITRSRILTDISGLDKLLDWIFGSGPY